MRLPRDEEEFTDRMLDAMRTSGPLKVVALCRAMLDSHRLPADVSRAEVLLELGEHLDLDGQHVEAGEVLRAAVADGGPTTIDARCLLARWCLDHGDAAEGEALLQQLWAERRRDLSVCVFVGELFERRGDLATATRWLSTGAVHVERQLDDSPLEVVRLLGSRRRVRRTQGFTPDDLDMAAAGMAELLLSALAIA